MIPVNVVTGFLGSGKTTVLREILRHADFRDAAVIVNEFGEIGLDHLLLEEVEEGVLLLENGCICCTIRSDLQETIRTLQARAASGVIPPFDRVFIETTGLADPAPILSTVLAEPIIRNHFRVGNILCTVDSVAGINSLENQPEAAKQVAVADRILITKTDLAEAVYVAGLEKKIRSMNPIAEVRRSTGSGFDAIALFGSDAGDEDSRATEIARWLDRSRHDHGHDTAAIHAFTLEFDEPIDWTAFGVWLTALLHAHGEAVLRVKGVLNVRESSTPVVIQGVQHIVHAPLHLAEWPDDDRTSRIVFIVREVDEQAVRDSLSVFLDLARRVGDAPLLSSGVKEAGHHG